jgi:hypothetical protein
VYHVGASLHHWCPELIFLLWISPQNLKPKTKFTFNGVPAIFVLGFPVIYPVAGIPFVAKHYILVASAAAVGDPAVAHVISAISFPWVLAVAVVSSVAGTPAVDGVSTVVDVLSVAVVSSCRLCCCQPYYCDCSYCCWHPRVLLFCISAVAAAPSAVNISSALMFPTYLASLLLLASMLLSVEIFQLRNHYHPLPFL